MDVIWHPKLPIEHEEYNRMGAPLRCTAWIKLEIQISQPKFHWTASDELRRARHWAVPSKRPQHSLDLSNVSHISPAHAINRSQYPYACLTRSFLIQTIDEKTFLFEAKTEEERDNDIHALKLMIARHASKVVHQRNFTLQEIPPETMWVSNIDDVQCKDVFVPPPPLHTHQGKDEV